MMDNSNPVLNQVTLPAPPRVTLPNTSSGSSAASSPPHSVWWIGQDGNVWSRTGDQVVNNGQFIGAKGNGGFDASRQSSTDSGSWAQINDPRAPSYNAGGGGGAAAGPQYEDTTAARNATMTTLDSLGQILNNKNTQAQQEYNKLLQGYSAEDALAQQDYQKQVDRNEGNRETNRHTALLGAAQGGRGLRATLASLGALGGTGSVLANRAIANEANIDIGKSDRTFSENAENLFGVMSRLKQQQEQRRKDAESGLKARKQANAYDTAQSRQDLWKTMADLWSKAGNSAQASRALGRSSAQTAHLVANTRPQVADYARTPLQYQAPALNSYLAGANDMTVNVQGGGASPRPGPINGVFAANQKRDEELA